MSSANRTVIDAREIYERRRAQQSAPAQSVADQVIDAKALPDPDSVYAARKRQATGNESAAVSGDD